MNGGMRADILILGQGLAGTLLAWELERAGRPFTIVDSGHDGAASCAAAGIINPITGRRLVKSWRVEELLPFARSVYRELGAELGVPLWRDLRLRRIYADERERRVGAAKLAAGELAPFAGAADDEGCWFDGAARVDLGALLAASRERWQAQGRLLEGTADPLAGPGKHEWVIDCTGLAATGRDTFDFVPWEVSKGELLEIAVEGLADGVILNDGKWVLPVAEGAAWIGATHEPGIQDRQPTVAARAALEAAATRLLRRNFRVTRQRVGVRVNTPDHRPVAGVHPRRPRLGLCNGLGAKGALYAPLLAREWSRHLAHRTGFDSTIDVARFVAPAANRSGSSPGPVAAFGGIRQEL